MINFILLGLIQILILPGLAATIYIRHINWCDRLIIASIISIFINYIIVGILYVNTSYSHKNLLIIFIIEILILIFYRKILTSNLKNLKKDFLSIKINILNINQINKFKILLIIWVILFITLYKNSFFTVFTSWDAVVSWNRWAVEIFEGRFNGSLGYPQALPIMYSIVYKFSNNTNLQTFSKIYCAYLPLLAGIAIFRCALMNRRYENKLFITAFIYIYLLTFADDSSFIFSGLVDPIISSYSVFLLYFIFLINNYKTSSEKNKIILYSIICISTSALFKITGIILTLYYLLVIYIYVYNANLYKNRKIYIYYGLSIIIITHWYVFSLYKYGRFPTSMYNSLQSSIILLRPVNLLEIYFQKYGIFSFLISVFILIANYHDKYIRNLTLFYIAPTFLFCSLVASYDIRASMAIFGPLSFGVGTGLDIIWNRYKIKICRILNHLLKFKIIIITLIIFITFNIVFTDERIIRINTRLRATANDVHIVSINNEVIKILKANEHNKILSCWQVPFGIVEAQKRFRPDGNCTLALYKEWLINDEYNYVLYWNPDLKNKNYATVSEVHELFQKNNLNYGFYSLNENYSIFYKK